jgi:hypothetical protein
MPWICAQATSADGLILTSQLALGLNFCYDFDFDFRPYLDNPSAYQLDPNADTLRLNTSNPENKDWGFGSDGANGAIGPCFDTWPTPSMQAFAPTATPPALGSASGPYSTTTLPEIASLNDSPAASHRQREQQYVQSRPSASA